MTGLLVLIAALVVAALAAWVITSVNGRFRDNRSGTAVLTSDDLGRPLGDRATFVHFSSAFCAPCRTTRILLEDVADRVDGIAVVEIDAEAHLELVRRLRRHAHTHGLRARPPRRRRAACVRTPASRPGARRPRRRVKVPSRITRRHLTIREVRLTPEVGAPTLDSCSRRHT